MGGSLQQVLQGFKKKKKIKKQGKSESGRSLDEVCLLAAGVAAKFCERAEASLHSDFQHGCCWKLTCGAAAARLVLRELLLAGEDAGEGEGGLATVSQFRPSRLDPSTFNGVSAPLDVFFHWKKKGIRSFNETLTQEQETVVGNEMAAG